MYSRKRKTRGSIMETGYSHITADMLAARKLLAGLCDKQTRLGGCNTVHTSLSW